MAPTWASFYILCPIPGTEQYDDFMTQGLVTETNLDRFDTTCLTWRHPNLSRERLSQLLFECYRKFFSLRHALRNVKDKVRFRGRGLLARSAGNMAMSLFSRYCAWRRTHPMSGGITRVRLDGVDNFLSLRKEAFGYELAPLPRSLQLPAAESLLTPRRQPARAVESATGT
jgi:hypothetical protein